MSFKVKIVFLILSVSLIPYIFIMTYSANILRQKYYENTKHELDMQLNLTIDKIEQYISMIQRDILFISELDIMNDIYSHDVDRRISNLLEKKKSELHLNGNFNLIDNFGMIIASSDSKQILKKPQYNSFYSKKVYSPFDKSVIGSVELEFSLDNISKLFNNSKDRHYYMILDNSKVLYKKSSFVDEIHVSKHLKSKNIQIVLEQNQKIFLELLNRYEIIFISALILGAFIISIIALFFINRLIKPIIKLSKVTQEITKKQDYSYQVKIYSQDEIGKLSISFNKMIVGMNQALVKLKEESKNRENLIEEKGKSEMLEQLSNKLSRYLSPQVYELIFSGEQDVTLTSKRKKLTIFFSDIVGFTDTTDTMESEDLSELLNDYLNEMTLIALKHGATVDKYIGDSIMLFFGDPYSKGIKEDAILCVSMALEMQKNMLYLHEKWKNKGFTKPFKIRIGIHTGYCTVGNFGSQDRLEYTIIGSSVNIASRIESSANSDEILISDETKLLVSDSFNCIKSKEIIPKGFKRPITLYRVENKIQKEKTMAIDIKKDGFELVYDLQKLSFEDKSTLKDELSSLLKKM